MFLSVPAELDAGRWNRAGRDMLAKSLAELSYELLLQPEEVEPGRYRLDLPDGISYGFSARRGAFGHWTVRPDSIVRRTADGEQPASDPLRFLLDARSTLGITGDTAGHLARELSATLAADTRLLGSGRSSAELADLSYVDLEGHQTGHPWIVPNKGRVGFSASDTSRYAPEARSAMRLPWIAVHTSLAAYRGVDWLPSERLIEDELDEPTRQRFRDQLGERGLDPADYSWLPVHPWQWDEIVLPTFAADIAAGRIVALGEGPDHYRPQQSIRTFTNVDDPQRHHVKLPVSILNTLVWRGLPTERTVAAPALTAWVLGLADNDPYLRDEARVVLLGEVASVTVRHPVLEEIPDVPYQYRELLGAIWRQPISGKLDESERARTLASLLHVDDDGRAFVRELVDRSGLDAETWLQRLFSALLPPLLHFLYRYGLVFSPHGENVIVVFDEADVPSRLAVKDFVDDVNVADAPLPELAGIPDKVSEVLLREQPQFLCQFIQSGLFVGHFRYLAPLVEDHLGLAQQRFWEMVRDEVLNYQAKAPELADRFAMFDLLTPEIERLCLNRNRLLLDSYRDRPERPHAAVHGHVVNPLHDPGAR
ncbi:IucA/IucC family siderophore biosynthesis protein [Saccharopolyspora sp. HNM0986]|uniref:IucA/IucC family protein n=1 Tax=Saccharopolyspora galaxeae TaxID=2781241 RepID=UPI00190A9776|nr:IucA/IucC family siderophore biosynthesis protein [Saccharopolyspora sp. HNM0986]MBK0870635.1 IucA/IucC family siderophore biosynthesis protein [Saccharopolyspora sp. HNM0986]